MTRSLNIDHPAREAAKPETLRAERRIVLLVSLIQFINILDFMMVMPLGPDFVLALGIPASQMGTIGGSYTFAAAISGIICSFFLDRFDRRQALAVVMIGLVVGTAAGGLAWNYDTLIAARLFAGAFGGPATALCHAIIADRIPVERRGTAMGTMLSAFAFASVLGVPAGLELARLGSWSTPFFAVAALGLVTTVAVFLVLPPIRGHLAQGHGTEQPSNEKHGKIKSAKKAPHARIKLGRLLSRKAVLLSYTMTATVMMASFMIIPNIATYVQFNLDYPRSKLGLLYAIGGAFSFVAMRGAGILVDRKGPVLTGTIGSVMFILVLWFGFVAWQPWFPVAGLFVTFMIAMSFRNVAYNTLTSRVPSPSERAGFLSIQSAVQHLASSAGAFLSAKFLQELPDGSLGGIDVLAFASIALAVTLPLIMRGLQGLIKN